MSGATTFPEARERAHVAAREAARLRLGGTSPEHPALAAAESAAEEAAQAAWEARAAERANAEREAAAERERARLTEREDAIIARLVSILRDRGPLIGRELESLRVPGAATIRSDPC